MPAVDAATGVDDLSELALAAAAGDTEALERLVAAVQDDVYRLALRMLWHPEDAQDATQEALVRIVTRVGSFRVRRPSGPGPTGWRRTTCSTGARVGWSGRTSSPPLPTHGVRRGVRAASAPRSNSVRERRSGVDIGQVLPATAALHPAIEGGRRASQRAQEVPRYRALGLCRSRAAESRTRLDHVRCMEIFDSAFAPDVLGPPPRGSGVRRGPGPP